MAAIEGGNRTWTSGLTFILAAVGAAVGLGNIWKFPYVAGVSGGGAFVLVYLLCVVVVAIPVLIAELLIGRCGSGSPPVAMRRVAETSGRSPRWSVVGYLGMIVGYLIATYYSVIAGWTLVYIGKAASGFGGASALEVANQFDELLADPATLTLWHTVFMCLALVIVGRGLRRGIERVVKLLMPALFAMLLVMIGYAAVEGDFAAGLSFLFSFDFSKITGATVLNAIGQAFFSISVAMGLMMVYGSYVPKDVSLTRSAMIIAGADTLIALLAGLMIFPLVFANGLDPAEIKYIGLARWDIPPENLVQSGLQGGWFAVPDFAAADGFKSRYVAAFGADPHPLAGLAYDGIRTVARMVQSGDANPLSAVALVTAPAFTGASGEFQFMPDGTVQRSLAVAEVTNGTYRVIDPAPRTFGGAGF